MSEPQYALLCTGHNPDLASGCEPCVEKLRAGAANQVSPVLRQVTAMPTLG